MQLPFDLLTLNHLLIPSRGLQTWRGSLRRGSSAASVLSLFGYGMFSALALTLSIQIPASQSGQAPCLCQLAIWSRHFLLSLSLSLCLRFCVTLIIQPLNRMAMGQNVMS
jgi:hypothetical protein